MHYELSIDLPNALCVINRVFFLPVGVDQFLHDIDSFADSGGHLYAVSVKCEECIEMHGLVFSCDGFGVNRGTVDFGADINNELFCKKRDISVMYLLTLCSSFRILTPNAHTVMSST